MVFIGCASSDQSIDIGELLRKRAWDRLVLCYIFIGVLYTVVVSGYIGNYVALSNADLGRCRVGLVTLESRYIVIEVLKWADRTLRHKLRNVVNVDCLPAK